MFLLFFGQLFVQSQCNELFTFWVGTSIFHKLTHVSEVVACNCQFRAPVILDKEFITDGQRTCPDLMWRTKGEPQGFPDLTMGIVWKGGLLQFVDQT